MDIYVFASKSSIATIWCQSLNVFSTPDKARGIVDHNPSSNIILLFNTFHFLKKTYRTQAMCVGIVIRDHVR